MSTTGRALLAVGLTMLVIYLLEIWLGSDLYSRAVELETPGAIDAAKRVLWLLGPTLMVGFQVSLLCLMAVGLSEWRRDERAVRIVAATVHVLGILSVVVLTGVANQIIDL